MMSKTLFCISDIHACYDEMIEALNKSGYDENNDNHLLIVCGDMFDRGVQAVKVYMYLKRLSDNGKAIILKGNHEQMFIDYLKGITLSPFNYQNNGTNETLGDFLERTSPFESWCFIDAQIDSPTYGDFARWIEYAKDDINKQYPELLPWLESLPYYYETKNYIFTHGAIDTEVKNWHKPHCNYYGFTDWEALAWDNGSFFGKDIKNTDKTVVIGHFGTAELREKYDYPAEDGFNGKYSILERKDKRVIAIDGTTILSRKVNVLVIKEEELLND